MAKGSTFEREVCVKLSKWWSLDGSDDLFWRTAMSGGRATVRGKKGKQTRGHCGDITATDPIGKPLTDLITFELKRGYSKYTLHDLLDAPKHAAQQKFGEWLLQATIAAEAAESLYWMIIHRRDGRIPIAIFPYTLAEEIQRCGVDLTQMLHMRFSFRAKHKVGMANYDLMCIKLDMFLNYVEPSDIRFLLKESE